MCGLSYLLGKLGGNLRNPPEKVKVLIMILLDSLAHRLRDIQQLPYVVVANPHLTLVYELYYKAFERARVVPEIRTLEDNDRFCDILKEMLREHLVAIPNLAIGVLECRNLAPADEMDRLMNTLLRAVCKLNLRSAS